MKALKSLLAFLDEYKICKLNEQDVCKSLLGLAGLCCKEQPPKPSKKKHKGNKIGTCARCGKTFRTYNYNAKFCSQKCFQLFKTT